MIAIVDPPAVQSVIADVRAALSLYVFRVTSEASLKDQVTLALNAQQPTWTIRSEVTSKAGRYDLLVTVPSGPRVVLELKLRGGVAAVERQAQRYAKMSDIDAVIVVTTSQRLAAGLNAPGDLGQPPLPELGGKPFHVIAVRTT
jgi:hypothetical protein